MKTLMSLVFALAITASAQQFTVLNSFDSQTGGGPSAGLVQGNDGNLYGTAEYGGEYNEGTAFKISTTGTLTAIHNFNNRDGQHPAAPLLQGTDGNFYGTTSSGGAVDGTVFQMTPGGDITTLVTFNATDGVAPYGGLTQLPNGWFYGTTSGGGSGQQGTIFKVLHHGSLTIMHNFSGPDGAVPYESSLLLASDGNLYGTTYGGGNNSSLCGSDGCGTIFKMTPSGIFVTLYAFSGVDGSAPYSGLIQATDGNFYGTTELGGNFGCGQQYGCGTIFKLTPEGALTTLYSFCIQQGCLDGANPFAGVIQANDGNLYGTTFAGGANSNDSCNGCGTIYQINYEGLLTTLYNFCSQGGSECLDGFKPGVATLIQETDGKLYGTTPFGGNGGIVFSLDVGLQPFVNPSVGTGWYKQTVGMMGQGFTGTTQVTFNGVSANFNVVNDNYLSATVPARTTTGPLGVATPNGTLMSNQPFHIIPMTAAP